MHRRRASLLLIGLAAACLLASLPLCLWTASALRINEASLVGVGEPEMSSYDCLVGGRFIRPGPALRVVTEWIIDDDLVPVLSSLRRQGWMSTTQMTSNIQMVPTASTGFNLGLLRLQIFRALSLSYTTAGTTRVVATNRFVACPA
jgi:hypothetical protein